MPRLRREWSVLRAETRRLLREDTSIVAEDDSFWSNDLLLDCWNRNMDLRVMELAEAHEGWVTDRFVADLEANQKEYDLPEGTGRIKRILLAFNEGGTEFEIPLIRDERWSKPMATVSNVASTRGGALPTYRLVGEHIYLEPPPTQARTGGLVVEIDDAPPRFDGEETQKLDPRLPDVAETLLIYDTALEAIAIEDAQGTVPQDHVNRLSVIAQRYAGQWHDWIETRSFNRVLAQPFYIGD